MLRTSALCAFSLILFGLVSSYASADILTWTCGPDTDGVITCASTWTENLDGTYDLAINGAQHRVPGQGDAGHILGDFVTDTELDPTVKMYNSIDNDMDFTWTDYHINITMNKDFTISNAAVDVPGDWTVSSVIQPPTGGGTGTINFLAGTGVQVGQTLDFHYWISFLGTAQYLQEMIPTPEPATLSMIAVGGLALLRRRGR